jgi:phage major head subunit gpT-like protein
MNPQIQAFYATLKTIFNKAMHEAEVPKVDHFVLMVESDTKSNTYGWLGTIPGWRKWIGDRRVNKLKEHGYTLTNEDFEFTIEADTNDLDDDKPGIYAPLAQMNGEAGKKWLPEMVYRIFPAGFTELCYDGQPFFDTDHPVMDDAGSTFSNFQDGSGAAWYLMCTSAVMKPFIGQVRKKPDIGILSSPEEVKRNRKVVIGGHARGAIGFGMPQYIFASKAELNTANYAAARKAIQGMINEDGKKMGLKPDLLLVPSALESEGKLILEAQEINSTTNVWKGTAKLEVAALLPDE